MFCFMMQSLQEQGKSMSAVGRSMDLTSAYRQLAIAEDSASFAYVAVYCPFTGASRSLPAGVFTLWAQSHGECLHSVLQMHTVASSEAFSHRVVISMTMFWLRHLLWPRAHNKPWVCCLTCWVGLIAGMVRKLTPSPKRLLLWVSFSALGHLIVVQ